MLEKSMISLKMTKFTESILEMNMKVTAHCINITYF